MLMFCSVFVSLYFILMVISDLTLIFGRASSLEKLHDDVPVLLPGVRCK